MCTWSRGCIDRSCCCRALPSRRSTSISTPVRAQGRGRYRRRQRRQSVDNLLSEEATESAASELTVDVHVTQSRKSGAIGDNSGVATQVTSPVVDAKVQRAVGSPLNGLQGPTERPERIRRKPMMNFEQIDAAQVGINGVLIFRGHNSTIIVGPRLTGRPIHRNPTSTRCLPANRPAFIRPGEASSFGTTAWGDVGVDELCRRVRKFVQASMKNDSPIVDRPAYVYSARH